MSLTEKTPIMRMLSRTGQQKSCTGRIFGLQQKISGSSTISRRLVIWIMWYATAEKKGKKIYSYRAFADEIDTILKELIQYDIALEINTGGYKAGLGVPNPTPDVIRRYRELGGEKITFGADAHKPEHIAFHFADAAAIAQEAGFRYYVRFKEKNAGISADPIENTQEKPEKAPERLDSGSFCNRRIFRNFAEIRIGIRPLHKF